MSQVGLPAVAMASRRPTEVSIDENLSVVFHSAADASCMEAIGSGDKRQLFIEMVAKDVAEDVETAGSVWYAGLALSLYLAALDPEILGNATVCELGAGCCVPGLVSAALGARSVSVTDLACNIEHMTSIIDRNAHALGCPVTAAVIEFGVQSAFDADSFSLILGADIGFDISLQPLIRSTLLSLAGEHTRIILCEEVRWKDIFNWYVEELETCFNVHVSEAPMPPMLEGKKEVKILLLTPKKC
jgi:predicted nicotinamide N-methyase